MIKLPRLSHKKKNLVSVILPAHNEEKYLIEAIESILTQTHENLELIVIDDASTDQTPQILKEYAKKDKRVKILTNKKNIGVGASLNRGLKAARGEFVARMDGDDLSLPRRLAEQVQLLKENPELVAVGTQVEVIDEENNVIGHRKFPLDPKTCYDRMMMTLPILHPAMMTRASVIKKYQYKEGIPTAEDWDMYFKLLKEGHFSNTPDELFLYRQRLGSAAFRKIKRGFFWVLRARIKGIVKYDYRPSWQGILITLAQLILVIILTDKLIFEVFNFWQMKKHGVSLKKAFA